MSYLCYLGFVCISSYLFHVLFMLFGFVCLSPVICRRVHVLFMLFGFVCLVFISSYL